MIRLVLNWLMILLLGFGLQACDIYNAAVKDTVRTETSASDESTAVAISVSPTGESTSTSGEQLFSSSGGNGPYTFALSGQTNSFNGASFSATTSATATLSFTIPTALEGTQILVITATDSSTAAKGSATFTLEPSTT